MIHKKRRLNVKAVLALIFFILIIAGSAYLIIYKPECLNQSCFLNSLWKCKSSTYLNSQENVTWYYVIDGPTDDKCQVKVNSVNIKADVETANALMGKTMTCLIPKDIAGSFMPEGKIEYCHGELKENIQDLIIKKLHLFIVQNIGQLNSTSTAII